MLGAIFMASYSTSPVTPKGRDYFRNWLRAPDGIHTHFGSCGGRIYHTIMTSVWLIENTPSPPLAYREDKGRKSQEVAAQ